MTGWIILGLIGLPLAVVLVCAAIPSPPKTPWNNLLYTFGRVYIRLVHRLEVRGRENLPAAGPILFISNHTAGIDPILISGACHLPIRWVMAQDMRVGWMEWFWRWQKVIFVGRDGQPGGDRGGVGLREAISHLKNDHGIVGIFPEGGLERPSRQILPFQPGVGLIVRRSKAVVVPVFVDGTPQVDPAWSSLWKFSRSRVSFGEPIDYAGSKMSGKDIADDLRARFLDWTGWDANDEPEDANESGRVPSKGRRISPDTSRNSNAA